MKYPNYHAIAFYIGLDMTVGGDAFTYEELVSAARMVAWHYSIGKPAQLYPPGDMFRSVLDAMARADMGNLAHLSRAFPIHGALMRGIKNDDPGTRAMILNLLKYHPSESWTAPADPVTPESETS